jgi:hypothetical protein
MSFLLRDVLLEPARAPELPPAQLGQLIRQARSSDLLASLTHRLRQAGTLQQLPVVARRHFESAELVFTKQRQDLEYETWCLQRALNPAGDKLILLKGAAYIQAGLPVGEGRMVSDVDILLPHQRIGEVELSLRRLGWVSSELDPYNERFYREWMHEIPPMGHRKRGTTLDLHHNILPPTASPNVNAELLFDSLLEVKPGVFTLSWKDMVIHSATHLFHEGEFHHGIRDLWDLDRMLRDFPARDSGFWQGLVARASQLNLIGSLFLGLTYARKIFDTPIPDNVIVQAESLSRALRRPLMDFLFLRAMRPLQPECRLPATGFALHLLYVRSHYLRLPLYRLIPHLTRKAWMGRFSEKHRGNEAEPAGA